MLASLCQMYDLGEPIVELRKSADDRYSAKVRDWFLTMFLFISNDTKSSLN
jgi:hypothetical protein